MACSLCHNAMPDGEWCRACGDGLPAELPHVEPMRGLRLAVRIAKGGPLSTDGPVEREALRLGVAERRAT
jgi:hypothetical protein